MYRVRLRANLGHYLASYKPSDSVSARFFSYGSRNFRPLCTEHVTGNKAPLTSSRAQLRHVGWISASTSSASAPNDEMSLQAPLEASQPLSDKDICLIKLFLAASWHDWSYLPGWLWYASCQLTKLGCSVAGYAPALSATKHLYNAQLLSEDTPGKAGGPPGNAFELVYAKMTDAVRRVVRKVDPVLAEWIRTHLYGDIYSSPGLDLLQKQLLMVAFLGQADMPDELFGHALAGLRFGAKPNALKQAVDLGFDLQEERLSTSAQQQAKLVKQQAVQSLQKAIDKYHQKYTAERETPSITIPDLASVSLPPLPPRHVSSQEMLDDGMSSWKKHS